METDSAVDLLQTAVQTATSEVSPVIVENITSESPRIEQRSLWILKASNWLCFLNKNERFTEFDADMNGQPSLFHTALTARQQEEFRSIINDTLLMEEFCNKDILAFSSATVVPLYLVTILFYSRNTLLVVTGTFFSLSFLTMLFMSCAMVVKLKNHLVQKLNASAVAIREDFQWRLLSSKEESELLKSYYEKSNQRIRGTKMILEFSFRLITS